MDPSVPLGLASTAGALTGSLVGALLSYAAARRGYRLERARLIASLTTSVEVEKTRITTYVELWKCLGSISTFRSAEEIVANLATAQAALHKWYYNQAGGLLLTGAADDPTSSKAAFFVARDLRSTDALEIWRVFHRLRRSIRRDLGVFESPADESAAVQEAVKKLDLPKQMKTSGSA